MKTPVNLTGKKFGNLTAVRINKDETKRGVHWLCKCDCGNETSARSDHLVNGLRVSCGCRKKKPNIRKKKVINACKTCGIPKDDENFYKRKNSADGYSSECKTCYRKKRKKWFEKNRAAYDVYVPIKNKAEIALKRKKIVEYGQDLVNVMDSNDKQSMTYEEAMTEIYGYK